jgi:hypothetical protein
MVHRTVTCDDLALLGTNTYSTHISQTKGYETVIAPLVLTLALVHGPAVNTPFAAAVSLADAATPTPAPDTEDPKVTAMARVQFVAWQAAKIDRALYTRSASDRITDDTLGAIGGHLADLGQVQSLKYAGAMQQGAATVYNYIVTCEKGKVLMSMGVGNDQKISAMGFRPAK